MRTVTQGGNHEGRKVSTLGNLRTGLARWSFGTSEGSAMIGTQKAKQRTFTTDIAAELPSLEGTRMTLPMKESRVGVLRLRLGCQIPGRGLWLAAVRIR